MIGLESSNKSWTAPGRKSENTRKIKKNQLYETLHAAEMSLYIYLSLVPATPPPKKNPLGRRIWSIQKACPHMVQGSSLTQLLMALKALKPLCSAGASLPGDGRANESQAAPVASAKQGSVHTETCVTQGAGHTQQRVLPRGDLCKSMQIHQTTCTRALVSVALWCQKGRKVQTRHLMDRGVIWADIINSMVW